MKDYRSSLLAGHVIEIRLAGYDTAMFWIYDGQIYSDCPVTGPIQRTDMTLDKVLDHIDAMAQEGATIYDCPPLDPDVVEEQLVYARELCDLFGLN